MEKEYFDKIADRGQLIIISGPDGSGKRSIMNRYLKEHESACSCVPVTTRDPRSSEVEGKDYFFISQLDFDRLIRTKQMLEYSYHGNYGYGIPKQFVEDKREAGKNVIIHMYAFDAMQVRAICPDATLIFIMPPTWEDLERRLSAIESNGDIVAKHLEFAKEEIACAVQYDYIIVNDTVDKAVNRIAQIIHGNRYSRNNMREFLAAYIESEIKNFYVFRDELNY